MWFVHLDIILSLVLRAPRLSSELLVPCEISGVFVEKVSAGEDSVFIHTTKELKITTLTAFVSFSFCYGHLQHVEFLKFLETIEHF